MTDKQKIDELKERVMAFHAMELPGQPKFMHMGTSCLVGDLWRALADHKEPT